MNAKKSAKNAKDLKLAHGAAPSSEKAAAAAPLATSASGKKPLGAEATSDARKRASIILEVLAGVRTTVDAAEALKVTLQRYYLLEQRAVEAVVLSCEPRPRGPRVQIAKELERSREEAQRLERENARLQALLRTTERAIGVTAPRRPQPPPVHTSADGGAAPSKRGRRRKPVVRALVAARALTSPPSGGEGAKAPPAVVASSAPSETKLTT